MSNKDGNTAKRTEDLAEQASRESRYVYSDFLTEAEQSEVIRMMPVLPVRAELYGGYDGAERKLARFGSEEELGYEENLPISILKIVPLSEKYAEALTHRDYLGAILNLGIDRRVTGDIITEGSHAWLFCLERIAGFIEESLIRVRHTSVRIERTDKLPGIALKAPRGIYAFVPSLRVDVVMCRAFKLSRAEALKYLAAERVFVNSVLIESPSYILREGDKVSVRGRGKFCYAGTDKQTRKGNLRIRLEIY